MYLRRLLLSLSLLCFIHGCTASVKSPPKKNCKSTAYEHGAAATAISQASPKSPNAPRHHVLAVPAMLKSDETEQICVNLIGYEPSLRLNVVLEYSGVNTTIFDEDVDGSNFFQCNDVKVPLVEKANPAVVTLSATGGDVQVIGRKTVVIQKMENINLIQMDKPLYRGGQKVRFRLLSLSPLLLPIKETYSAVYLTDPSGSRIAQWLDEKSDRGVAQMEFQLNDDASTGSYFITAEKSSGSIINEYFTVEDYVLPRFDVSVISPNTLSILQDTAMVNVSAKYTYGQPVPGSVTIRSCKSSNFYGRDQNCFKDKSPICTNVTGKLDADGTFHSVMDLNPFYSRQIQISNFGVSMQITVTEEGTEIQVTENRYIWITTQPTYIRLDNPRTFYKRGLYYQITAILTDENGKPLPNETVDVDIDGKISEKVVTGPDGKAEYMLDTSNMADVNFTVRVSYTNPDQCYHTQWDGPGYPTDELTVQRFYSKTGCFLQLTQPSGRVSCEQTTSVEAEYVLGTADPKENNKITFYYMVLSKAAIVHSGQQVVALANSRNGTFKIDLPISSAFAPSVELVVYGIQDHELFADTVHLEIERCFKHQVSMGFSEEEGAPGSSVDVQFSSAPGSICGIRAIDYGLLILRPYEQFNPDNVYYSMSYLSSSGYDIAGFNVEEPAPPCEDPNRQIFFNGSYWLPVSSKYEGDTYTTLKDIGLILDTDASTRKQVVCNYDEIQNIQKRPIMLSMKGEGGFAALDSSVGRGGGFGGGGGTVSTVRQDFSDTWLWEMVLVDDEGQGTISRTVPDSITKWQGHMFCVSEEEGFGMTLQPANFTSLLPFFVEISMPNSINRGETMVLVAVVSNSLEYCTKVRVTLEDSSNFKAILQEGTQDECICSGDRMSFSWNVDAVSLGEITIQVSAETTHIGDTCDGPNNALVSSRKDTVIRILRVEAEGVQKEATSSQLICVEDSNVEFPLSIDAATGVVEDSVQASITVLGDMLSLSVHNLQKLIQQPTSCGEQTLARMAPIPYIVQYLNNTDQLTPELLQTCKDYLSQGYYRLLGYRLYSGAYGVFGGWKGQGNSWLSANAFKTFEQAKSLIFIDEKIQQQTLIWLESTQNLETGCFRSNGRLFMIQEEEEIILTAYISIALLESNYSLSTSLSNGAMSCLEAASKKNSLTTYSQVLMTYAFTLAKNWDLRSSLLQTLNNKAISEGGTKHWEREKMPNRERGFFFSPMYPAAEVEMTSYMLLSSAKGPSVTKTEMSMMAEIAVWIIRQRNSLGGFRSSQDTVVAMQALAAYAQIVFVSNAHQSVTIKEGAGEVAQFTLNQDNRLLVQRHSLDKVPGEYSIGVNGRGCCLVQSTIKYNIPVKKENSAFSVTADTSSDSCVNGVAYTFTIDLSIAYQGSKNQSNMAIIDIKMISGYQADYLSLRKMEESDLVSKAEVKDDHVYLYLNTVSSETINLSFKVLMGNRVLNVKTSSIYAYDYYESEENGYAQYSHPCPANN
ncbi:ovostatin-like [Pelodytes ibericus]